MRKLPSSAGLSLVELLVTVALLAFIMLSVSTAFSQYYREYARAKDTAARDRYLNAIVANIEFRIGQMDLSFDTNATLSKDVTTFPFYWSADSIGWLTEEECLNLKADLKKCPLPGRMAFMIKPVNGLPSMYETTIYFYHPELNSGDIREYHYFLAVK